MNIVVIQIFKSFDFLVSVLRVIMINQTMFEHSFVVAMFTLLPILLKYFGFVGVFILVMVVIQINFSLRFVRIKFIFGLEIIDDMREEVAGFLTKKTEGRYRN